MLKRILGTDQGAVQHSITIEGDSQQFETQKGETLLKAAARQNVVLPSLCNVGECGSCRCRVLSGDIRLKKDVSMHISESQLAGGEILACQAVPESAVHLHVPGLSPAADNEYELVSGQAVIVEQLLLSPEIMRLDIELSTPVAFHAGQYLHISHTEMPSDELRCYSIANAAQPGETLNRLSLHIRRVCGGAFTEWLWADDRCGRFLSFSGAFGDFVWREQTRRALFFAAGSGFAPVYSLMQYCLQETAVADITLVFSARDQRDLYCREMVEALQKQWPGRLHFIPCLTREADQSDWQGVRGHVDEIVSALPRLSESTAYICGSDKFVAHCFELLDGKVETLVSERFLDRRAIADRSEAEVA